MSRVDLHVHALMADALFFFRGRPGSGPFAGRPGDIFTNQVSLAGWRDAEIGVALAALYSPPVLHRGRGHLRELLRQAAVYHVFARTHEAEVAIAADPAAARRIAASGRTALVLTVEGAHGIAAPADVEALGAAGISMITLAHLRDNAVAAASAARMPLESPNYWLMSRERRAGIWRNRRGLTPLGREVVRAMQGLGMLMDLAHVSDRGFDEVLALTHGDSTPLIVSHTASRALWPTERNLADSGAQAIAERGGVVGVTLRRDLLWVDGAARPRPAHRGSTEDFVAHFQHLAAVMPAGHVVLGSDLNGFVRRPGPAPACPCGVRHVGDWPVLERALAAAGVPRPSLEHSTEPFLRAWDGARALATGRSRAVAAARGAAESLHPS